MKSNNFCVNEKTFQIDILAGDTAGMTITLKGYDFQASDRALFTVAEKDGEDVISKLAEIINNEVVIDFASEDTNYLDPETEYEWDLRTIVNPSYDEHGKVILRDAVSTPGSPYKFIVHKTVGKNV